MVNDSPFRSHLGTEAMVKMAGEANRLQDGAEIFHVGTLPGRTHFLCRSKAEKDCVDGRHPDEIISWLSVPLTWHSDE
jgi:hypothetical protein